MRNTTAFIFVLFAVRLASQGIISVPALPVSGQVPVWGGSDWSAKWNTGTALDYGLVVGVNTSEQAALNRTAVQAMLDATGICVLPGGVIRLDSCIKLKGGQKLIGQGIAEAKPTYPVDIAEKEGTTVYYTGRYYAVEVEDLAYFVEIKGLTIRGTHDNMTANWAQGGIKLKNVRYGTFERIHIDGLAGLANWKEGIRLIGGKSTGDGNTFGLTFRDCRVYGMDDWGLHMVGYDEGGANAGVNITFYDCFFETNGNTFNGDCGNVWMEVGPASDWTPWVGVSFYDCNFSSPTSYAFACDGAINLVMDRCYWEQTNPVTRPLIYFGRAFSSDGSYLYNVSLLNSNMGTQSVTDALGVVYCKPSTVRNLVVGNMNLDNANATAPVFGGGAIELSLSGFYSTITPRKLVEQPFSAQIDYRTTIKKTPAETETFMAPSGTTVPFGESRWAHSKLYNLSADSTYRVGNIAGGNTILRRASSPNGVQSASAGDIALTPVGLYGCSGGTAWVQYANSETFGAVQTFSAATGQLANAAAATAGVPVGNAFKWDNGAGNGVFLMFRN